MSTIKKSDKKKLVRWDADEISDDARIITSLDGSRGFFARSDDFKRLVSSNTRINFKYIRSNNWEFNNFFNPIFIVRWVG